MHKVRVFLKRLFTPVTLMLIPHSHHRPWSIRLPSLGFILLGLIASLAVGYVLSVGVKAVEYRKMKEQLQYYSSQFLELRSTMYALRKAEQDFRELFSLRGKEEVLKHLDETFTDSGALDMEALRAQIRRSMQSVADIREYLSKQHDLYRSTPRGWPVSGYITSGFGWRVHPITGRRDYHSGVDISTEAGMPVRATADGIVSFAGWSGGNGNLVVIEHGNGYSTLYAHNRKVLVRTGQVVKRGDVIAYAGSTGSSTGPNLHYEVWHKGKPQNPRPFILGRVW